jgi:hypothetical protein
MKEALALLSLLLLLLAARYRAAPRRDLARGRRALALAVLGANDAQLASARRRFLEQCTWPASVCFGDAPLMLAVPWYLHLAQSWDERVLALHDDPHAISSYAVPTAARMETARARARPPVQIVFPARALALQVPDFRFLLGPPRLLRPLLATWFPSFFWGLLVDCPVAHLQEPRALATDAAHPPRDPPLTTLLAAALSGSLPEEQLTRLFEKPPPYGA